MSRAFQELSEAAFAQGIVYADLDGGSALAQAVAAGAGGSAPAPSVAAGADATAAPAAPDVVVVAEQAAARPLSSPPPPPSNRSRSPPQPPPWRSGSQPASNRSRATHKWDTRDVAVLREEETMARATGVPWQERGPPGPTADVGGPSSWRGQPWREGSQRFAKRGGRHREYYAAKYGRGSGSSSKGQGKGSSKGQDKGKSERAKGI